MRLFERKQSTNVATNVQTAHSQDEQLSVDIKKSKIFLFIAVILLIFVPFSVKQYWAPLLLLLPAIYFGLRTHSLELISVGTGRNKVINGVIRIKVLGIWTIHQYELTNIQDAKIEVYESSDSITHQVIIIDNNGTHRFGSIFFTEKRLEAIKGLLEKIRHNNSASPVVYHELSAFKRFIFIFASGLALILLLMPLVLLLIRLPR